MGPTSAAQERGSHPASVASRIFRFGVFELDARSGELRRHGQKIRLPHQAFQVLVLLLSRPGEVISIRELDAAVEPVGGTPRFKAYLGYAYAAAGRTADARRVLNELFLSNRHQR